MKVTYISQATCLIEWDGVNILTDPVFSKRIFGFYRRLQPLKYDPAKLPKLDAILLSHAHYDHLDLFSYKYISGDIPIVIPEGMSKAIAPFVNNPIVELATWAKYPLNKTFEICAVPAKHIGGRLILPYRYRTCHGYVITHNGESLYFSGDTGYRSDFLDLGKMFKIKLALLDSALSGANWYRQLRHMTLKDIVRCWEDLGRPDFIPIHWGSFFGLPKHRNGIPKKWRKLAETDPELKEKLHILEQGASFEIV